MLSGFVAIRQRFSVIKFLAFENVRSEAALLAGMQNILHDVLCNSGQSSGAYSTYRQLTNTQLLILAK